MNKKVEKKRKGKTTNKKKDEKNRKLMKVEDEK